MYLPVLVEKHCNLHSLQGLANRPLRILGIIIEKQVRVSDTCDTIMKVIEVADMCFISKGISLDYNAISQRYTEILEYVFKKSESFSIVTDLVRPYSKRPPLCKQDEWIADLQEYMISQEVGAKEWPGVRNRNCHKVLTFYRACRQAREILCAWPNAFYACEYNLPEDICFYRDGKVWFGTTSHERTADVLVATKEEEAFFDPFERKTR